MNYLTDITDFNELQVSQKFIFAIVPTRPHPLQEFVNSMKNLFFIGIKSEGETIFFVIRTN